MPLIIIINENYENTVESYQLKLSLGMPVFKRF